jgi:predicted XRE-type DNA-binding protein
MGVRFRNLTVDPSDPVAEWGVEGMLTAIDRGGLAEWQRMVRAAVADADGVVAGDLREALDLAESTSSAAAVRVLLEHAQSTSRERTVDRIRQLFLSTEYSQAEAAERLGTSRSRLSTYLAGKVMPSAEFLVRLEALARTRIAEVTRR